MVPRGNALVDYFLLLWVHHQVRVDKLGHLQVVSEDVDWQIDTLGDGNELILIIVVLARFAIHHQVLVLSEATTLKRGDRSDYLAEFVVKG